MQLAGIPFRHVVRKVSTARVLLLVVGQNDIQHSLIAVHCRSTRITPVAKAAEASKRHVNVTAEEGRALWGEAIPTLDDLQGVFIRFLRGSRFFSLLF